MRTFKLTLAYDGTDFHGWQRQLGLRTVQEELEKALEQLTCRTSEVSASGRTDAGVHALGQVAHFHSDTELQPEVIARGLNALLPRDVRVLHVEQAAQSFHATLDARSKRYRYIIDNAPVGNPILRRYAWHVQRPLDAASMHRAGQDLIGRHDFRSFETDWPNRLSSVRTIHELAVTRRDSRVEIEVEADGFLYNMVRAIAGTLVLIGTDRRSVAFAREALEACDRRAAGPNAPPAGLFLVRVEYIRSDHQARVPLGETDLFV
jgi:tRNA pseudouridine38-40 synthase